MKYLDLKNHCSVSNGSEFLIKNLKEWDNSKSTINNFNVYFF